MTYRVGYHRISDDSVTSYPAVSAFIAKSDARILVRDDDIDHAWVRDHSGEVIFKVRG
jgi:hypothetical protein